MSATAPALPEQHRASPAVAATSLPSGSPAASQPLNGSSTPRPPSAPPVQPFNPAQPVAGPSRLPQHSNPSNPSNVPLPYINGNAGMPVQPTMDGNALQARIALAQQAMQASIQRQTEASAAANGQGLSQADGGNKKASGQAPDWAAVANAMGMLNNMSGAASKEAMMKQLQALTNTHAHRARLAGNAANPLLAQANVPPVGPSPSAMSASSPAAATPSQFTPSADQASTPGSATASAQPAQPSVIPGPPPQAASSPAGRNAVQLLPGLPTSINMEALNSLTPQQREYLLQQRARATQFQQQQAQVRPPQSLPQEQLSQPPFAAPSPSTSQPIVPPTPVATATPAPPRPPAPPARGPQMAEQRKQFLHSLMGYYKQNNLPPNPDVINGERDGSVKMGDTWVELVELFMTVMRGGGFANIMKQGPDNQVWHAFITARGFPNPLPQPVQIPRPTNADPSLPTASTTSPVQFLMAAYFAYLQGFELHMARHRQAAALHRQHQQATQAALAAGRPPPPMPIMPNGMPLSAPSPAYAVTPSAATPTAPSPAAMLNTASAPSPATIGTPTSFAAPAPPVDVSTPPFSGVGRPSSQGRGKKDSVKPVPAPIRTDDASPTASTGTPTTAAGKKRKKDRKTGGATGSAGTSDVSTPTAAPAPILLSVPDVEPERPPTPKRARYRVEYRPLHHPQPVLAGWDERAVASTFPKHMLGHPTRSIHELGLVDMEAILMGLRSRLPRELGYALTVLSMLSMPIPEENMAGLPIHHILEIYIELLELITEAAFGEEGFAAWEKEVETESSGGSDLNRMSWLELEQLGSDFDFSFDIDGDVPLKSHRDHTGGSTDIVLTGLNLLRNLSMVPNNHLPMVSTPELFHLLARISDARLARLPGQESSGKPYSILELARVRRDCVAILTNLGGSIDLRRVALNSVTSVFRLLSTFLTSGWASLHRRESPFGPTPSIRDAPPPVVLSINRALEAWCKLSHSDGNREVLSRVPAEEQMALFEGLVRLFPVDRRGIEAMHTMEDFLGYTECIALSVYSLAFLAPQPVRATMRGVPGALAVLTRIVFHTAPAGPHGDFKSNPFNILCRRVCEILGVLNGTVSASGDGERMTFSAGGGEGTGWTFRSKAVEKGWLAGYEEKVVNAMMVRGMDLPAFEELDGLWWAGNE